MKADLLEDVHSPVRNQRVDLCGLASFALGALSSRDTSCPSSHLQWTTSQSCSPWLPHLAEHGWLRPCMKFSIKLYTGTGAAHLS